MCKFGTFCRCLHGVVHLQVHEKSLKAIEIKLEEQSKTLVELKGKLLELKLNDSIKTEKLKIISSLCKTNRCEVLEADTFILMHSVDDLEKANKIHENIPEIHEILMEISKRKSEEERDS